MSLIPWTLHSGSEQFIYNWKLEKQPGPGSRKLEELNGMYERKIGTKEKGIQVVLRRYANKSRVKVFTQTKVVLRQYTNKSRVKVFTQIIGLVPMPRK